MRIGQECGVSGVRDGRDVRRPADQGAQSQSQCGVADVARREYGREHGSVSRCI